MRAFVALLLASTCALAAPPDPATAKAKELFTHAEALYALTRYDEALAEYEKAYEAKPLPGFLFNIGQCHRQLGHWEKAAYFYRAYLEREPSPRNRPLVDSLIAEMDEKTHAHASPPPVVPPPDRRKETPRVDLVQPAPAPLYRRWYVWAGAAAAAVIVVAVVLGVTLSASTPTGSLGSIDAR